MLKWVYTQVAKFHKGLAFDRLLLSSSGPNKAILKAFHSDICPNAGNNVHCKLTRRSSGASRKISIDSSKAAEFLT